MENFIKTLESIKTRPVRISVTTRGEQIQQTDRNILKKDIMKATVAIYQPEYKNLFNKAINFWYPGFSSKGNFFISLSFLAIISSDESTLSSASGCVIFVAKVVSSLLSIAGDFSLFIGIFYHLRFLKATFYPL